MKSLRSEVSKRSKYYVPHYRYLELKNMCLQYQEWKKELKELDNSLYSTGITGLSYDQIEFKDPVFEITKRRETLVKKIELIKETALYVSPSLSAYILQSVTSGVSYDILQPPCGRRQFYEKYRKFFFYLDKKLS